MEWRGVTITNVYIGNFLFVAGLDPQDAAFKRVQLADFSLRYWHGHNGSVGARTG